MQRDANTTTHSSPFRTGKVSVQPPPRGKNTGTSPSSGSSTASVTVRPAIQGVVRRLDRETATVRTEAVELPLLGDVPVFFPRGGGCTLTFPVQKGDECVVVFASRCIDGWWQSGGV